MRLMSFDLALTASGVVDPDGNADTLKPPPTFRNGERLAWWHQTFLVLLDQHQPDRIAIESPYVGHANNTLKLGELYGVFRLALVTHARPIVITWIPPSSLKKAWTGSGRATKDDMWAATLNTIGDGDWQHMDDNAIDALALWHTTRNGHWDTTHTGDAA